MRMMRHKSRYFVSAVVARKSVVSKTTKTDIFKIYSHVDTEKSHTGLEQHGWTIALTFYVLTSAPYASLLVHIYWNGTQMTEWENHNDTIKTWQQSVIESTTHAGITHSQAHKDGWTGTLTFSLCYHSLSICSCCRCAVHVADSLHSSVLPLPAVKSLRCSSILAHVLQDFRNWHS